MTVKLDFEKFFAVDYHFKPSVYESNALELSCPLAILQKSSSSSGSDSSGGASSVILNEL